MVIVKWGNGKTDKGNCRSQGLEPTSKHCLFWNFQYATMARRIVRSCLMRIERQLGDSLQRKLPIFVSDAPEALGRWHGNSWNHSRCGWKEVSPQTSHYDKHQVPLTTEKTKGIRVFSLQVNPGIRIKSVKNPGIVCFLTCMPQLLE